MLCRLDFLGRLVRPNLRGASTVLEAESWVLRQQINVLRAPLREASPLVSFDRFE